MSAMVGTRLGLEPGAKNTFLLSCLAGRIPLTWAITVLPRICFSIYLKSMSRVANWTQVVWCGTCVLTAKPDSCLCIQYYLPKDKTRNRQFWYNAFNSPSCCRITGVFKKLMEKYVLWKNWMDLQLSIAFFYKHFKMLLYFVVTSWKNIWLSR